MDGLTGEWQVSGTDRLSLGDASVLLIPAVTTTTTALWLLHSRVKSAVRPIIDPVFHNETNLSHGVSTAFQLSNDALVDDKSNCFHPSKMKLLKVEFFVEGKGADANGYRPNKDESQWWSRRDALVRCMIAF